MKRSNKGKVDISRHCKMCLHAHGYLSKEGTHFRAEDTSLNETQSHVAGQVSSSKTTRLDTLLQRPLHSVAVLLDCNLLPCCQSISFSAPGPGPPLPRLFTNFHKYGNSPFPPSHRPAPSLSLPSICTNFC